MEFLDTYKSLDNLCKDLFNNGAGITSYINEMDSCRSYSHKIENWESDYQNLKHYRYIRNQIVHENCANESSLCNENDVIWLENFHQRILNQTDPLALYRQIVESFTQQGNKGVTKKQVAKELSDPKQEFDRRSKEKRYIVRYCIVIIIVIVIFFAFGFFLSMLL